MGLGDILDQIRPYCSLDPLRGTTPLDEVFRIISSEMFRMTAKTYTTDFFLSASPPLPSESVRQQPSSILPSLSNDSLSLRRRSWISLDQFVPSTIVRRQPVLSAQQIRGDS
jgi:hypothetical protein